MPSKMHLDVGEELRAWVEREAQERSLSVNGMVKVILHAAWEDAGKPKVGVRNGYRRKK